MASDFRVNTPSTLKIRKYEFTTKEPVKFVKTVIAPSNRSFKLFYKYHEDTFKYEIEVDGDETEVIGCTVMYDQHTLTVDVENQPRPDSRPDKLTVDFEETFGKWLPHRQGAYPWLNQLPSGSPPSVGTPSITSNPPTHSAPSSFKIRSYELTIKDADRQHVQFSSVKAYESKK
jgi:hypothetical protein